jgi:phage terminase large subunit GpA-like protein
MAPLVFSGEAGHVMRWPEGEPEKAFFECQQNGCIIEHKDKRTIVERGEWRAAAPFKGHASFHVWAAYSYSPGAEWARIAAEFLEAKENGPQALKTFINTVLGETWKDAGEAPDWERLYQQREPYQIATVPDGVLVLTAGVDVQKDRWVYEVVGWGAGKESWSIESGVIPGDTSVEANWEKLDELLGRTYPTAKGSNERITVMAVDSGYNTQMIYNWARHHVGRVIATKGVSGVGKTLLGTPTAVDVTYRGKRIARGCKVWPVGVDIAKSELYGWLRQKAPLDGAPYPSGWCHFPEYGHEFFKQLTGEQLVSKVNERTKFTVYEWHLIKGRENHFLDARVYARAAASLAGLDRMKPKTAPSPPPAAPVPTPTPTTRAPAQVQPAPRKPRPASGFLSKGGSGIGNRGRKGWLR